MTGGVAGAAAVPFAVPGHGGGTTRLTPSLAAASAWEMKDWRFEVSSLELTTFEC
jgi:hypothetical protein